MSRPSGSTSTQSRASTAARAARISSSVAPGGAARARFSRRVPTKTWCSWVTSATCPRRSASGSSTRPTPPTVTEPVRGGWMPASSRPRVDLPAPEGPDHGEPGARFDVEVDAVQHVAAVDVGEADVGGVDLLAVGLLAGHAAVVGDLSDAEEPGERGGADLELVEDRHDPVDGVDEHLDVEDRRGHLAERRRPLGVEVAAEEQGADRRDQVGQLHAREEHGAQVERVALGGVGLLDVLRRWPRPAADRDPATRWSGRPRRSR